MVEREYDRGAAHFRALDVKAATLVTLAGALIALGKDLAEPWRALCVAFAVLSALCGLGCYLPRERAGLDPAGLQEYMVRTTEETTYQITRELVLHYHANEKSAKAKRKWLKYSLASLCVTAVLYGIGTVNPHLPKGGTKHVHQQPSPAQPGQGGPAQQASPPQPAAPPPPPAQPQAPAQSALPAFVPDPRLTIRIQEAAKPSLNKLVQPSPERTDS
ncbi:hypothetical protein [Catenulispora sp. GAS73]|uniref:hypothetical protein n=1 Tax=Catenulispora sp. GAS73 TaxID=3156269 RepID=UPI003518A4E7